MNKQFSVVNVAVLSMAIAPITISTAPANAASITLDYEAEITGDAFIFQLAAAPLEETLGLPPGTIPMGDFTLNETLTGTLTSSFEREQYLDGDISFNLSELSNLSGLNLTNLDSILSRSTVTLTGSGTLTSDLGTLPFNIGFNEPSQSIQFSFDRDRSKILDGCLVGTCTALATGIDASIILNISPSVSVLLATANDLAISLRTNPRISQSVQTPEASTWLGLIGIGGLLTKCRKKSRVREREAAVSSVGGETAAL
jgi:hypothetical protein